VAAADVLYLGLVRSQGGSPSDNPLITPFVASYLAAVAAALIVSLAAPPAVKVGLRAGASAGLVVMALLAAFSIGIALLLPAGLGVAATVVTVARAPGWRGVIAAIAGSFVAVSILAAGFVASWSYISCPPSGESGGTTATGTSYSCASGVLTTGP